MEYYHRNGIMVRSSILEDVKNLTDNIRKNDAAEILACGTEPYEGVKQSFDDSVMALTVIKNDKVIAMSGLTEIPNQDSSFDKMVIIWLLSSNEIWHCKTSFGIISKKFLKVYLNYYPILQNFVDARYTTSINWIKWLGGKLGPEVPIGLGGALFKHFIFRR